MKKTIALLLSLAFVFLLSSCGEKPAVNPETTESTSAVVPETTEKQLPYWDTHEIGTYAGMVNGERFSGDFGEFIQYVKCKNGDIMLSYDYLKGMVENENNPNLADEFSVRHPHYPYIFYDASLNRYTSAWDFYWKPTNEESRQNCDEIIIIKGGGDYYYNETACVVPNSYDLERIEANDEYVVRIYERTWGDETKSGKTVEHYYWKKGAGLIGIYAYDDHGNSTEINIRFTSKTADGWKMDETIVPNALEGSERTWPEKLWPEEYKGLDDPELLAILNEY